MNKWELAKEFMETEFPKYKIFGWTIVVVGVLAVLAAITLLRWVL